MRVLVSGATGVIGRRVLPLLLQQGHSVTALARTAEAARRLSEAGVRPAMADLFDSPSLRTAAVGHDAILNLATHMPSNAMKMALRSAWRDNDRIRTEGAANLADAAIAAGVRALIQESFALTYPDRGDGWIDESIPLQPAPYNRTVLDAEAAAARFAGTGGRGVALRFAAFYGPDAMQVRTYLTGLRFGWAGLPGGPDAFISSVSHDDAAAAVVAALEIPSGAYNVGDDEPLRRGDYFGAAARLLGRPAPHFAPRWTTPLFGAVGDAMSRSLRIDNAKLKAASGWAPRLRSARDGWREILQAEDPTPATPGALRGTR